MDYNTIANDFWENGYVIFENFFSDDIMDTYNNIIKKHYGVNPEWEHDSDFISKSEAEVIPWFPYRENKPYFDGIDKNQQFNKITDAILKNGWDNLYCMMMFSKKGSKGQAWHQD